MLVFLSRLKMVAPLVGAWIETWATTVAAKRPDFVAPLVGAWIETILIGRKHTVLSVAPLVGAWIETWVTGLDAKALSRTPRGCVD